jgi:Zn-dependent protease with chaperone function
MQLLILAALLATLAQTEPASAPVTAMSATGHWLTGPWQFLLILAATLAAPLATAVDGYWFVGRLSRRLPTLSADWHRAADRYQKLQLASLWLWLAGSLVIIYVLDWPGVVRGELSGRDWFLVDDLLMLLPMLSSLVLIWMGFFAIEQTARRLREQSQPGSTHQRMSAEQNSLRKYLVWQFRHYLAMALFPALLVLGANDLLRNAAGLVDWPEWFTSNLACLLGLPLLAVLPIGLPLVLARLWPTSDLPAGELRTSLESISSEFRTPLSRLLVWHTQGRMANAAVAGVSRLCRYLFLTDALLVQLSPGEISAVVRHELGHLQQKHLQQRMLLLAIPALAWFALQPHTGMDLDLLSTSSPYALAVSAGYLLYAVLVVGVVSQWFEYDADLAAVLDSRGHIDGDAARDLIHALVALQGPHRESRLTHWLHPPTSARVAWIRRVLMHPAAGWAYRRRLRSLRSGIYAVTIGLMALLVLGLATL